MLMSVCSTRRDISNATGLQTETSRLFYTNYNIVGITSARFLSDDLSIRYSLF